jgi:hypothetical protein
MERQRVGAEISLRKSFKTADDEWWTAEVRLWNEESAPEGTKAYVDKSEELETRVAERIMETAPDLWEAMEPGGGFNE